MPDKFESHGSRQVDDKSGAAVDHGPVCVTARRTWNCSWYHETCGSAEGRRGAVPSGVVDHGGQHADRALRGSCV